MVDYCSLLTKTVCWYLLADFIVQEADLRSHIRDDGIVGRGGALVKSMTPNRSVVGSSPALAATYT